MNEATKAMEMIDMRNLELHNKRCGTDQVGLAADGLPLKRADRLNLFKSSGSFPYSGRARTFS
jgi:hypothetical protein